MDNKKINKIFNIIIVTTVLVAIFSLGITLASEKTYTYNTNMLEKVRLIGDYHFKGEKEKLPLPRNGKLGLSGYNNVIIEGHFNKDIQVNKQLIMRIDNIKLKIFINDKEIYSFGHDQDEIGYAKSEGNLWTSTVSPGIKSTDKIRVEISNVYTDHVETTFASFFDNLYSGYESALIIKNIKQNPYNNFVSVCIICIGGLSIVLAFIIKRVKSPSYKLLHFGGLCISSGMWFFLDFNIQNYMYYYPVFNNSLDILSSLFSMFFLITYFSFYLDGKERYILFGLAGTFIVAILTTTVLQFCGIKDYYECLFLIQGACFVYAPVIVGCIFNDYKKRRSKAVKQILIPTLVLAIGILGDAICNMLDVIPNLTWFRFSYLIFIIIQFGQITSIIRKAVWESTRIQVLEELAFQDGLTGAKNRTAYINRIKEIKKNSHKADEISILVFDINGLKVVNDTFGHEYGDKLIQKSANLLMKVFNKESVYRIGGDEFVVIRQDKVNGTYLKLIDKFKSEVNSDGYEGDMAVSVACGATVYNFEKDKDFDEAFSRADKEMYENKSKMKLHN